MIQIVIFIGVIVIITLLLGLYRRSRARRDMKQEEIKASSTAAELEVERAKRKRKAAVDRVAFSAAIRKAEADRLADEEIKASRRPNLSAPPEVIRRSVADLIEKIKNDKIKFSERAMLGRNDTESMTVNTISSSILHAEERGLLGVIASGVGSWAGIKVEVQSLTDRHLSITIEPGTVFWAADPGSQNMICRRPVVFELTPFADWTGDIPAMCINYAHEIPKATDYLLLNVRPIPHYAPREVPRRLVRLLRESSLFEEDGPSAVRRQQVAVWIITDNLSRTEIENLAIYHTDRLIPRDRLAVAQEIHGDLAVLKAIFDELKLSPNDYRAFNLQGADSAKDERLESLNLGHNYDDRGICSRCGCSEVAAQQFRWECQK